MTKKYLVIDMSYWQSTYTKEKLKLLKDWGLKGVILRAGYADVEDSLVGTLISYCRDLDIPFGLYFYLYPSDPYYTQIDKFISIINKYPDTQFGTLDFEEYKMYSGQAKRTVSIKKNTEKLGSNYEQYSDQSGFSKLLASALTTNYNPDYLNTFYKNSFDRFKTKMPNMKLMVYSGQWCMDAYFPKVSQWVKPEFYWNACYAKYYKWYQNFIESLGGSWNDGSKLISISNLPLIMEECSKHESEMLLPTGISGCVIWQFGSLFPFSELSIGQRNIDMNLLSAKALEEWFGVIVEDDDIDPEPPPVTTEGKKVVMEFVSQLGVGAGMYNNDCGPASDSIITLASKGIFVQPDQWYAMDGWGAPSVDEGTDAYQLQKALGLFDIPSSVGTSLDLNKIHNFIDNSLPFIPLVDYKVLSNAGVTYYTGDFLHWFVVNGYDNNNIFALDPYRPYEVGGEIVIPNSVFLNSYRGSYLVCSESIEGGLEPMTYNASVNSPAGLNVRSAPSTSGNKIITLTDKQKVYIETSTITTDNWGNITNPVTGWVSMNYIKLDDIVPPQPPTVGEAEIRLNELSKMKAYISKREDELS